MVDGYSFRPWKDSEDKLLCQKFIELAAKTIVDIQLQDQLHPEEGPDGSVPVVTDNEIAELRKHFEDDLADEVKEKRQMRLFRVLKKLYTDYKGSEQILRGKTIYHIWETLSRETFQGRRSPEDVFSRWRWHCNDLVYHGPFTKEESHRIATTVDDAGGPGFVNWEDLARQVNSIERSDPHTPRHNAVTCFIHYQQNFNQDLSIPEFTAEHDKAIFKLLDQWGEPAAGVEQTLPFEWMARCMIQKFDKNFSADSLKSRYRKLKSNSTAFSKQDKNVEYNTNTLWFAYQAYGNRFADIIQHIDAEHGGCSDLKAREAFSHRLKDDVKSGVWSKKEDEFLLEHIEEYGPGNWSLLSSELQRSDGDVQRRFHELNNNSDGTSYDLLLQAERQHFKKTRATEKSFHQGQAKRKLESLDTKEAKKLANKKGNTRSTYGPSLKPVDLMIRSDTERAIEDVLENNIAVSTEDGVMWVKQNADHPEKLQVMKEHDLHGTKLIKRIDSAKQHKLVALAMEEIPASASSNKPTPRKRAKLNEDEQTWRDFMIEHNILTSREIRGDGILQAFTKFKSSELKRKHGPKNYAAALKKKKSTINKHCQSIWEGLTLRQQQTWKEALKNYPQTEKFRQMQIISDIKTNPTLKKLKNSQITSLYKDFHDNQSVDRILRLDQIIADIIKVNQENLVVQLNEAGKSKIVMDDKKFEAVWKLYWQRNGKKIELKAKEILQQEEEDRFIPLTPPKVAKTPRTKSGTTPAKTASATATPKKDARAKTPSASSKSTSKATPKANTPVKSVSKSSSSKATPKKDTPAKKSSVSPKSNKKTTPKTPAKPAAASSKSNGKSSPKTTTPTKPAPASAKTSSKATPKRPTPKPKASSVKRRKVEREVTEEDLLADLEMSD